MNANPKSVDDNHTDLAPFTIDVQEAIRYITKRSRDLVSKFVKETGHGEPPFLAEELAPFQRVKYIVKEHLGDLDALLVRESDGQYIIKLNANRPPSRQNFSCAHEIGHIFLDELTFHTSAGDTEFRTLSSNIGTRSKERLCDVAAAELLMPHHIFKRYLEYFGVSVSSIERLAEKFKVSIHATAIRIAEVSPEPCIAIKWKPWQKTRSKGFIAKHMGKLIYVRDPSALFKAYQTDSAVKSFKSFEIGSIKKRCAMESKGFGHGNSRFVMSLVLPNRHSRSQSSGSGQKGR